VVWLCMILMFIISCCLAIQWVCLLLIGIETDSETGYRDLSSLNYMVRIIAESPMAFLRFMSSFFAVLL